MNSNRLTWIDSLKGIALCGIIMVHSGGSALPSVLGKIGGAGRNGVQLFFILSSLLTFSSLEKFYRSKTSLNDMKPIKWIVKKILYLSPLFYSAVILYTIIVGGAPYWYGTEGHITLANFLSHIFFLHGFFPHYINSIINVEWYIGNLAIFYFIAPLLYKIIDSLEKSVLFTLICIVLCYYINQFAFSSIPSTEDSYIYSNYIGTFWFFAQLPALALGINIFYILKFHIHEIHAKKLLSYTLLIFGIIMMWGQANNANHLYLISFDMVFGFWWALIIISQSIFHTCLIDNPLFRTLGKHSYPIYLFHYFMLYAYERFIPINIGSEITAWLIKYLTVTATTMVFSLILEKYIDIPLKKIINHYFR